MAMGEDNPCKQYTAEESRVLGNTAFQSKNYEEAILHYSSGIEQSPNDYRFFSNRCAAYTGLKQYENALLDAQRCVDIDGSFQKGHLHLQRCLRHFNRHDEALQVINNALQKWPDEKELLTARRDVEQSLATPAFASTTRSSRDEGKDESCDSGHKDETSEKEADSKKEFESAKSSDRMDEDQEDEDAKMEDVPDPEVLEAQARAIKDAGNDLYKAGKYTDAIRSYTRALDVCPTSIPFYNTILGNRSAAYMMIRDAAKCREDCERSISIDPTQAKVVTRLAMTYVAEAAFDKAMEILASACLARGEVETIRTKFQDAQERLDENPFAAMQLITSIQEKVFCSNQLDVMLCRCHLDMGNYNTVQKMTAEKIRRNPQNTQLLMIRAEAAFRACEHYPSEPGFVQQIEKTLLQCKQALSMDPDSSSAFALRKKLKNLAEQTAMAKEAVHNRNFESAIEYYSAIADADPKNKGLVAGCFKERANANLRLKNYKECIKDAQSALSHNAKLAQVYYIKARAHQEVSPPEHDKAIALLEKLMNILPTEEAQTKLKDAIFLKKKFERPDLYAELGVPSIASAPEIRKGYREKSKTCHPDKAAHLGEAERQKMEEKFKTLTYYYEILCDPDQKALYDKGYDLDAIKEETDKKKAQEQCGARFGGFGGGGGGFHFGGGGGRHHFGGGGGFPF